jgi:Family of unknown function (DUF6452)
MIICRAKLLQHIYKNTGALLAIAWFLSLTSCRDFQDCRTPYKDSVAVAFRPINKEDALTIDSIYDKTTSISYKVDNKKPYDLLLLPLNIHANTTQFIIYSSSPTSPDTLTVTYKKEAVLISHQCGCAYKYVLKEVTSTGAGRCQIINKVLSTLNESNIDVQIYL